MKQLLAKYKGIIIITLVVIFGYFEFSFFIKTLKFDAIYAHYPWRYIIVNSLREWHLPLWNYFQHLGLPIHADPQSGAWYPIVWIFSLFGKYSLYSFNIEYIFHLLIAAFGFCKLLKHYNISYNSSILGGLIYVFSGFFVGHAAHFTWIISISWIPWVVLYFDNVLRSPDIKNSIFLSLTSYMLLTGGYPAFTIILVYILIFWTIIYFIKNSFNILIIKYLLISTGIIIFLSAAFLISTYNSLDYFVRGHGIDYKYASQYALNYKSFISLLLPFSVVSVNVKNIVNIFGTDISMSNLYFGLLPLLFTGIYFFNNKKIRYLYALSFIFILISLGDTFFIQKFLFENIPGFNLFRFPALYRYFYLSVFIGLAMISFDKILIKNKLNVIKKSILGLIVIFISIIILSSFYFSFSNVLKGNLYSFFKNDELSSHIFFQSIIQIAFLITSYIIVSKKKHIRILLSILIIIDMVVSLQIYAPFTIYSYNSNLKNSQLLIQSVNNEFSLKNNINILENSDNTEYPEPFDKAFNVYQNKISYKGNYSFILKNTSFLMDSMPVLFSKSVNGPFVSYASMVNSTNDSIKLFKRNSDGIIKIKKITSNAVSFLCNNDKEKYLLLIQNYYPGWKVKVNNKNESIIVANTSFMAVKLPAGKNTVEFYFKPLSVIIGFYISFVSLIFILLILCVLTLKTKTKG